MRYRPRIDKNQPAIVKALRAAGASVQPLAAVGKGCPDLLVGFRGVNLLIEVKDGEAGAESPSHYTLTPNQKTWHRDWHGQVAIVNTPEEALAVLRNATARLATVPIPVRPPGHLMKP